MTEDPFSTKNLIATAYMAVIAGLGGAVGFVQKVKAGKARPFNIPEFVGEIFVSGSVGVVTYWIMHGLDINDYLAAAGVAIAGHMGTRAIFLLESKAEELVKNFGPK